ncbi:pyruvate, water dikinase regulatory protein [Salisediminibacterium beveridgei]|uniref:Putative pyruvate, phosphate dikinase regulatory protein n=1 Tax=Salisediminibacterium beveridgei TaxID=632773 RepID=A0A1D7QS45_9BACI|nr:pyruvate, water dikinase regulatory protein [Salisediminibacterium beveridgei]AOM81836.1 hypothetical protein BBEV_0442 [Salisediminibacterium beveridgei]
MSRPTVYVLSDSIGETAEHVAKAVASQFPATDFRYRRIPYISDHADIDEVIRRASEQPSILIYTLVTRQLKTYLDEQAAARGLTAIDLMNPLMKAFSDTFSLEVGSEPGGMRKLDDDYFRKISAIEFAVRYDDAQDPSGILKADLVIVGVSRTSKTPLSMYLAHQAYKVTNIPLVPEVPVPDELYEVPPERCVGLIINPEKLNNIRQERLKTMGLRPDSDYARFDRILGELEYAEKIMKRLGCPVIDVTARAVEETAHYILDTLNIERRTL